MAGSIKSDSKISRKNVLWAKQEHITKISINISHSVAFSLKRSDQIAPSIALIPSSSLVHHPTPVPTFTVIHSPTFLTHLSVYPWFSLSFYSSVCNPRRLSQSSPLSYFSLFTCPSLIHPHPTLRPCLPSLQLSHCSFVSFFPPSLWQPLH